MLILGAHDTIVQGKQQDTINMQHNVPDDSTTQAVAETGSALNQAFVPRRLCHRPAAWAQFSLLEGRTSPFQATQAPLGLA